MPYLDLPAVRLWYTDEGSGVPVLLLHAASGTTDSWVYQVPAFVAAGYRCVAFDRRGWGRSRPNPAEEQSGCAADDLHGLVEHLGLDRFHLVGQAAGAAHAVDYSLMHPDRVRSLLLADGTAGVEEPAYLEYRRRCRPPEIENLPVHLRELSATYRGDNPQGVERWSEIERQARSQVPLVQSQRTHHHITFSVLETLRVPTRVIVGDADLSTPPGSVRLYMVHIPGCEIRLLPEAGHAAFWEQPERWNELALEFVGRH